MKKACNNPIELHGGGDRSSRIEEEDEIVQELPTMRSVAMMSSSPSLDSRGRNFGIQGPPLGFGRPLAGLTPLSKAPPSTTSSFGVKKEWSAVTSVASWNVKGEDLDLVPVDYPLERTHREIMDADASVVASRISGALASLSIETEFDCKKAKAKCKTGDLVSFRIRLYSGNESGQPVVIEVQRRCGSASSFMTTCRALLSAAEGRDITTTNQVRVPPFVRKPVSELKCLQPFLQNERNMEHEASFALEDAVSMLRSDLLDSNRLGLENMVCLTDPLKTSPAVALLVSKSIALGDEKHDIREEIRLLTDRDVFATDVGDDDRGATSRLDQLRHYALMVFSNALSMCAKDGCLERAVKQQQWFSEQLIPSLVDELKRASTNACNAYQAACCLSSLLSSSDHARRLFLSYGGIDLMREAKNFGEARHALLATETERCLKLLDSFS